MELADLIERYHELKETLREIEAEAKPYRDAIAVLKGAIVEGTKKTTLEDLVALYQETKEEGRTVELFGADLHKPYWQAMQAIENECLARLQAQGLQNAKTPHGTAYLATQTRVSVKDKQAFLADLLANAVEQAGDASTIEELMMDTPSTASVASRLLATQAFAMLDIRALKEPVKEFVKENNANPPGVEVSHWVECNIRKS